jgi:His/Glu/Gln/Arg/opine family amino acid ABC transporter permease subunit
MVFNVDFMLRCLPQVMGKFKVNLSIACYAFAISFALALIINVIFAYKLRILTRLINVYISLARALPIYLQIVLFFFGLPVILRTLAAQLGLEFNVRSIPPMVTIVIAFTFNMTAYLTEALRGGVAGIPKGEIDAAFSVGMTLMQTLKRVIIPQAVALTLPSLSVLLIGLTHSTTLAFGATIIEMNGQAAIAAAGNGLYFEAFLVAGILFWVMTLMIELLFAILEKLVHGRGRPREQREVIVNYA